VPKPKLKLPKTPKTAPKRAEQPQTRAPLAKARSAARPLRRRETRTKKPRRYPGWMQGIVNFVRETRGEWRRVQWPTFQQAWHLTRIVLLVTFSLGAFLGLMDWVFARLVGLILKA